MSYPKTKKEAIERLIEKVEKGLEGNEPRHVLGKYAECPFCQWATKKSAPLCVDITKIACGRCSLAFGKRLGYGSMKRYRNPCVCIIFGSIEFLEWDDDDEARQFLTALLPVLKEMLEEMK